MNISLIRLVSHLGHLSLIITSSAMKAAMSTLLDKYLLTGNNFIDYLQNVRIVSVPKAFFIFWMVPSQVYLQNMILKKSLMTLIST